MLHPPEQPDQPQSTPMGEETGTLQPDELKRRASAGIVIVGTRGLGIMVLAFGGNIVLARLLTPHAFGVVAIGMAFVLFGSLVADGGLGAGLIRRAEPPAAEELRALNAFQLSVTVAFAATVTALAAPFGETGWVTALIVWSTPVAILQLPGRILLERSLSYRPLAVVELSQVLVYNIWAVTLVVLGFGVWGLASATVAMRVVGVLLMARVIPAGFMWPRFSWRRVRPLLGFGIRFQATNATWIVRDQGLNLWLAAIASVSTLGLWTLASRVLQVPGLWFQALIRVSFPTMSQLVAAKEDAAPLIQRGIAMVAVGSGIILAGLAGSAPGLFPGLFGEQWRDASLIMPGACLGMAIGTSIAVSTQGYLYAVGDASAVLRSTILSTIAMLAVTFSLLPLLGVRAIGLGWFVNSVVQTYTLRRAILRWIQLDVIRPLVAPIAVGGVSAGAGWIVSDVGGADLLSGILGGACAISLFIVLATLVCRKLARETFRFALASVRATVSQRSTARPIA